MRKQSTLSFLTVRRWLTAPNPRKGLTELSCYAYAFAGLLSDDAVLKIRELPIEKLVVTNTICQKSNISRSNGKLETMDVSPVIAEAIRRVSVHSSFI